MTDDDLAKIDEVLTQQSRFLAAVVREHGVRMKGYIDGITATVLFCVLGGAVAAALLRSHFWALILAFSALGVLAYYVADKISEHTLSAKSELWTTYNNDKLRLMSPEESARMTPEELRRVAREGK
jgi:hypothetical protein